MSKSLRYLFLFLLYILTGNLQSCKKETETFKDIPLTDYYPLQIGKYIIYQLDSTVFTNFETRKEIHSYQVKDLVTDTITDNENRPGFQIRRMIRDSAGLTDWKDLAVFMATPLDHSIEYVEDNLRYIKLKSPVRENFNWQGNRYIDATGALDYLSTWDYTYAEVGHPFLLGSRQIENTVKILQSDETMGDPELYPNNIASKNYSIEVYGKDIGLIYKDFIYWFYQKNNTLSNCRVVVAGKPDTPCPYDEDCELLAQSMNGHVKCDTIASRYSYNGYGIKLQMLEHN